MLPLAVENKYRETSVKEAEAFYLDNEIPEQPIVTKDVDTEKDLVIFKLSVEAQVQVELQNINIA